MWSDDEWFSHRMNNGKLQCIRDQLSGKMFNPYPKDSPEYKGYHSEQKHREYVEDIVQSNLTRLGYE